MAELLDTIGKRLAAARHAIYERTGRALSQAQFARDLDVSAPTAYGWENDEFAPELERFPAIAARLGVSESWLVWNKGPRYADSPVAPVAAVPKVPLPKAQTRAEKAALKKTTRRRRRS